MNVLTGWVEYTVPLVLDDTLAEVRTVEESRSVCHWVEECLWGDAVCRCASRRIGGADFNRVKLEVVIRRILRVARALLRVSLVEQGVVAIYKINIDSIESRHFSKMKKSAFSHLHNAELYWKVSPPFDLKIIRHLQTPSFLVQDSSFLR